MKRVWAYYRVSTKSQVLHHDTTLQQKACLNYIFNFRDWELKREIEELAVSGYSVKLENRKGINRIFLGAKQKEFDVLLVFMLDRIGRKEEEMKYLFDALQEKGIEIWSVTEGMVSYFSEREAEYYLQCSKEVEKTSQRVKRRFAQLNEEGTFTGGSPAFGYQIIKLDGKSELAIYPKEAEVVKKIFHLAANNQFGCSKISQELNQDGICTRNGKQWIYSTINSILRNPIYIGHPAYNKCSNLLGKHKRSEWKLQPKKDKLVIVNNDVFFKTQELMDKRNPYENHSSVTIRNNFLLSDLIYCGYCDKKLKAENNRNRPKKINEKSFDTKVYRRYVCDHAKNKHEIHDQRDFGADKHEEVIISLLIEVMNEGTFSVDEKKIKQERESCLCEIDKIKHELKQLYSSYFQLRYENQLQKLAKLEKESLEFNKKLFLKEAALIELMTAERSIELLLKELSHWNRNYVACSEKAKKEMLGRIINKVILKKGNCEVIMKDYVAQPLKISHQIKK
ncbi:recombinase family protein [Neobacillus drentensis]|uniref:recombinase family protein n=1 Tax=Neobacillus drentensis TaxID=220684 RepID=UPI002FFFCCC2